MPSLRGLTACFTFVGLLAVLASCAPASSQRPGGDDPNLEPTATPVSMPAPVRVPATGGDGFFSGQTASAGRLCRNAAGTNNLQRPGSVVPEISGGAREPLAPINYLPDFQLESDQWTLALRYRPGPVTFTSTGRPLIRDRNLELQFLEDDGTWKVIDLKNVIRAYAQSKGTSWDPTVADAFAAGANDDERVLVDYECRLYTLVSLNRFPPLPEMLLLASEDDGVTWEVLSLGVFDPVKTLQMEAPSNGRFATGPPTVVIHNYYDPVIELQAPSANRDMWVYLPEYSGGHLVVGDHFLASTQASMAAGHSGKGNFTVTTGDRVTVVYTLDSTSFGGVEYNSVVTLGKVYFRDLKTFSSEFYLTNSPLNYASAPGVTDDHDMTFILPDAEGYIWLLAGGHNKPLDLYRSNFPDDILHGITFTTRIGSLAEIGSNGIYVVGYAYAVPRFDAGGNLHITARLYDVDAIYKLVHMVRPAGSAEFQTFTDPRNSARTVRHQVLIDAGRPLYAAFYQETFADAWGRMFVSYSYYPDLLTAREAGIYQAKYGLAQMTKTSCTLTPIADDFSVHPTADVERCHYAELAEREHYVLMQPANTSSWRLAASSDYP